ncbi:MAG TPA: prepilin-type N-terminal cleavage/methylation domain-containing protein [Nitrospirae bacterium]|nr:prepilin-type N-terminal cleavage/methylation domain-containing protein [Nitrospirota bacterium]
MMLCISNDKKGFTLIELLIAMAILGILAAISIPIYLGQQSKAAFSEAKSNLESLRLLEEQFFAENGRYAPDPDSTVTYLGTTAADGGIEDILPGFNPGLETNLRFIYTLTSLNSGTQFRAIATGKGGNVEGAVFSINERNEKSW